jgi:hypothetical protein
MNYFYYTLDGKTFSNKIEATLYSNKTNCQFFFIIMMIFGHLVIGL